MTLKNRYPLLRIDELFDQIKGATIFSKIDFRSGYHQVHIKEEDIYKTTFRTKYQHYEFVEVPFTLTNSLATIKFLMKNVLCPYLDKFLILFINDILVYSKNKEEHAKNLAPALIFLREHQLYTKINK